MRRSCVAKCVYDAFTPMYEKATLSDGSYMTINRLHAAGIINSILQLLPFPLQREPLQNEAQRTDPSAAAAPIIP